MVKTRLISFRVFREKKYIRVLIKVEAMQTHMVKLVFLIVDEVTPSALTEYY